MEGLKFTIIIPPTGQRRHRSRGWIHKGAGKRGEDVARAQQYKGPEQRLEEDKLTALLYEHRPSVPFQGALSFGLKAFLPIPKSFSKKKRAQALAGEIRPVVKPDLDNLLKNIKDVMKGAFWIDDKQVVEYLPGTGKYYGDIPHWEIEVRPFHYGGHPYCRCEVVPITHPELW